MHALAHQALHRLGNVRVGLEALLTDGRAEHGDQAFALRAELFCHDLHGLRQDACRHAAPAGVRHACGPGRRIVEQRHHAVRIKAAQRRFGQGGHDRVRLPRHRLMQTHAGLVLGHDRDLRVMDLLCHGDAALVHAEPLRQNAVVFQHVLPLVAPVEAEVEALAVAAAHAAELGGKGMADRQPVTGIVNERAALVAVHRRVHGFPPYHSSEPSSGMTSFMAVIATSIIESSGSNTVRCWIMRPGQRSAREMTLSERPA